MAAVRSKDTKPELVLRRALWARGHRYRLYAEDVLGCPDLVFRSKRVVVFVDGDFWHGRLIQEGQRERFAQQFRRRRKWWLAKVQRNVERDRRVREALEAEGWIVVRIWESDVLKEVDGAIGRVEEALGDEEQGGRVGPTGSS